MQGIPDQGNRCHKKSRLRRGPEIDSSHGTVEPRSSDAAHAETAHELAMPVIIFGP
jgi:hypothetical protein